MMNLFFSIFSLLACSIWCNHLKHLRVSTLRPVTIGIRLYNNAISSSFIDTSKTNILNGTICFMNSVETSIRNGSFMSFRIVYKNIGGEDELKYVNARNIKLKDVLKMQFIYSFKTNDKTYNFPIPLAFSTIESLLNRNQVKSAHLVTSLSKIDLLMNSKGGILKHSQPTINSINLTSSMFYTHDRQKNEIISINEPFLQALKITTLERDDKISNTKPRKVLATLPIARPRTGMSDKYRQIQRFVEILDGLVAKSQLSSLERSPVFVDMGSGLAYLTFAVSAFLILFCNARFFFFFGIMLSVAIIITVLLL